MRSDPLIACLGLVLLAACNRTDQTIDQGGVATVQVQSQWRTANQDLLTEVVRTFYSTHPDQYDILVLWSAPEFSPGHSFYLPVKNDVPGIGYENEGPEFFDDGALFGSARLQGIVWMGPDWITNADEGSGPRSVLGILAQETGHRWASTVLFMDPSTLSESDALLEDGLHWSRYLNTGASPLGGNEWISVGNSTFQAAPVDRVEYSQLDLYLMGLMPADEVDPLQLLVNVRPATDPSGAAAAALTGRVSTPVTVEADVMEVSIDQIIAVEGRRDPDIGFNAKTIRQAWIYVGLPPAVSSVSAVARIKDLQGRWDNYFGRATGGRSLMSTSLH